MPRVGGRNKMIAQFRILLPYDIFIAGDEGWLAFDGTVAVSEPASTYHFKLYAPALYAERPDSTGTVHEHALSWIAKMNSPTFSESLLLDGKRVSKVNVLVIDFIDTEFSRASETQGDDDPLTEFAFELANEFLARLRVYSRAAYIKPLVYKRDPWHLRYLTDNFEDLEKEEGKLRSKIARQMQVGETALTPETMQMVASRWNSAEPYVWDGLLLDAQGLWPDIGSSIVLAYAALETFIEWALGVLQEEQKKFPEKFWRWIRERDHWMKNPSVGEQFDALLFAFTGRSLKDDPMLWTVFTALKKARNTLVHEGSATEGKEKVNPARAKELIAGAEKIIAWVEQLLPETQRRSQASAPGIYARRLATPEEAASFVPVVLKEGQSGLEPGGPGIRLSFRAPGEDEKLS